MGGVFLHTRYAKTDEAWAPQPTPKNHSRAQENSCGKSQVLRKFFILFRNFRKKVDSFQKNLLKIVDSLKKSLLVDYFFVMMLKILVDLGDFNEI